MCQLQSESRLGAWLPLSRRSAPFEPSHLGRQLPNCRGEARTVCPKKSHGVFPCRGPQVAAWGIRACARWPAGANSGTAVASLGQAGRGKSGPGKRSHWVNSVSMSPSGSTANLVRQARSGLACGSGVFVLVGSADRHEIVAANDLGLHRLHPMATKKYVRLSRPTHKMCARWRGSTDQDSRAVISVNRPPAQRLSGYFHPAASRSHGRARVVVTRCFQVVWQTVSCLQEPITVRGR